MTILIGQALNNDDRTPTSDQLLSIPKMPAVIQVNVMVGSGDNQSYNTVNLAYATKHLNAGGTVVVAAHYPNPLSTVQNISSAWVANQSARKPSYATFTVAQMKLFTGCTNVLTSFLKALPTQGRVIVRLFHEAGGLHFWWGRDVATPGQSESNVKSMFVGVRQACLNVRPNTLFGFSGAMSWYSPIDYGYPGSAYADYVGASLYSTSLTFAHSYDWSALLALGKPVFLFEVGADEGTGTILDGNTVEAFTKAHPQLAGMCFWTDVYSLYKMVNLTVLVGDPNLGWLVPLTSTVAAVNVLGSFTSLSAAKAAYPNATFTVWPLPSVPNS